jgi:DNA primase
MRQVAVCSEDGQAPHVSLLLARLASARRCRMSSAYERVLDALRERGSIVNENGSSAKAQCPAHDDNKPSLSITPFPGKVLLYCHAQCRSDDVVRALGLQMHDLFDNKRDVTYPYPDGREVHRNPDKTFWQSGNTKGDSLYRADIIGDAETVYVCEGEQDVDAVASLGAAAVCNAMGAGKAHLFDWSPLKGKHGSAAPIGDT